MCILTHIATYAVSPPYGQVPQSQIRSTTDQKCLKNVSEHVRYFFVIIP